MDNLYFPRGQLQRFYSEKALDILEQERNMTRNVSQKRMNCLEKHTEQTGVRARGTGGVEGREEEQNEQKGGWEEVEVRNTFQDLNQKQQESKLRVEIIAKERAEKHFIP